MKFEFTKKLKVDNSYSSLKKIELWGRLIAKDANGRVIFDTSNQDEIPLKGWTFTGGLKKIHDDLYRFKTGNAMRIRDLYF